ncbi:FAD/NAD(P)-binding protein [Pseudomonas putida]
MDIAIVGAGPTGMIDAIAVCKAAIAKQVTLHIYEPGKPYLGRSLDAGSSAMRLNTSVGVSFIDPADEDGLLRYAQRTGYSAIDSGGVVPRDLVAQFLRESFEAASEQLKDLCWVSQTVDDIRKGNDGRPVIVTATSELACDAVFIATGLPFKPTPAGFEHPRIISPYPAQSLTELDRHASVLLLGSRLSAIDALVQLAAQGHAGSIAIYSPSGLFPSVRSRLIKYEHQQFLAQFRHRASRLANDYSKVQCLVALFKEHLQCEGAALSDIIVGQGRGGLGQLHHDVQMCRGHRNAWQSVVMDIIDAMNELLPALDSADRSRFLTQVHPWLGRLTFAMPLCNAQIVDDLFMNGQLKMLSRDEWLTQDMTEYASVINATGLEPPERDPLLARLESAGLIRFNGLGGVVIDASTCRLNDDLALYANGAILQGEVYTANSIYSSSYGAQKITRDIQRASS